MLLGSVDQCCRVLHGLVCQAGFGQVPEEMEIGIGLDLGGLEPGVVVEGIEFVGSGDLAKIVAKRNEVGHGGHLLWLVREAWCLSVGITLCCEKVVVSEWQLRWKNIFGLRLKMPGG